VEEEDEEGEEDEVRVARPEINDFSLLKYKAEAYGSAEISADATRRSVRASCRL
jgi:hypothetical protein